MSIRESVVRDHFAATFHGCTEVPTDFGRIDVELPTEVVEVEPFASWRHGVRQALAYAQETGKRPAVAVYGSIPASEALAMWRKCSGLVALYILDHHRWVRVAAESDTDRWWQMPPDDLKYRPRRPARRLSPLHRQAVQNVATMLGTTFEGALRMRVVQEWLERNAPMTETQIGMFE